jgi:UDP-GlcNAc:undecaprenyl-phosphate GlcNAc-1-phosphate transferase
LLLDADSVLASTVPRDFGVASAALMIAVLAASILAERARLVIVRIGCYASATFAVYLAFRYPSSTSVAISGYAVVACGILAAAILCAIRFSLTEGFHITPMDYLILFILLLVGLFAEGHLRGGGSDLGMAIVKVIVLLYGLELLMTRIAGRWNGLALASLATLGILSVRGLFAPMAGG